MQTGTIQSLIGTNPRDAGSALPDGFDFEQTGDLTNPLPLRFWEIDHFFKCPAIGMCLDIAEQKQILKNAGISLKKKNPFQIHETLVATSENENKISRKLDLKLGRKFRSEIERFFDVREDEFMRLWKAHFEDGESEGIFWVAAIRPYLSPKARRAIFGDIHMSMHLGAKRQNEARQALVHEKEKGRELTLRLREASGTGRTLRKENKRLKHELSELRERCLSLEKNILGLEKESAGLQDYSVLAHLRTENQELELQLGGLSKEIKDYRLRFDALQRRNGDLESKLERQHEMNGNLREEMGTVITQFSSMNRCDESCPSFNLCRKRVLIVGGITKMETLYRKLIEESAASLNTTMAIQEEAQKT